jgi:hypothetical protein
MRIVRLDDGALRLVQASGDAVDPAKMRRDVPAGTSIET